MERATQERLVGATLLIVAGVIMIPWLLDGDSTDPNVIEHELVLPGGHDSGNETRRISLEVPRPQSGSAEDPVLEIDARTVRDVDEPATTMNLPAPKPATTASLPVSQPSTTSTAKVPARFAKPMPESTDSAEPPGARPQAAATSAPDRNELASVSEPPPARTDDPPAPVSKPPVVVAEPVANITTPQRTEPKPAVPVSAALAGKVWAVQVGSFASQENADRLAQLLRGKSYKAFVMRNVVDGRVLYRVRVGPVDERSEADLLATALREDRQPARVLSHP